MCPPPPLPNLYYMGPPDKLFGPPDNKPLNFYLVAPTLLRRGPT